MTGQDFHLIGIGVSEGGIEPLRTILFLLPFEPNAAFFVLNHLPPDFPSFTAQLLQHYTTMPIHEGGEDMLIMPGHVYLTPVNYYMTVYNGFLKLEKRELKPKSNRAINIFLNSIALNTGGRAVGILLSGSGNDGVEGLANIASEGGITIVQSPETAKFPQMAKTAIEAGVAIFTLEPVGIADLLNELIKLY
jgi:two-component system CheB/CheR fusion protein